MSAEQTTIDTTDALAVECEKKARMFLEQALGPVITDIGNSHGRDGIVAFCAGMRWAASTAEHESMMKAAGDVLSGKAH
jgi:hypothetical protein